MEPNVLMLCYEHCRNLRDNYKRQYPNGSSYFEVETGRKYFKIVMKSCNSVGGSVHAFVDKETGDVYKPASWNAPAKGIRCNLFNHMEQLRDCADWAGGYLYRR